MHFFNPAPVMPLLEIVGSVLVHEHVLDRVRGFASGVLGKTAITVKDRAGFIVNALLFPTCSRLCGWSSPNLPAPRKSIRA